MSLEQKEPVIEPIDNAQMPESPMQEDATALMPTATAPMQEEVKPVNESLIPDKKRKRRRSKKNSKCKSKMRTMAKMRNCKCICKSKRRAKKSLYEMYSNDGKSQF
jgi:hypothetical protein